MATTYVGLLRGINVGGKNKLPMKDLAAMFVAAGCGDVRTFIQSGNVIFKSDATLSRRVPDLVAAQIAERFGYRTPVVLRSAEQIREVIRANPFVEAGTDEDALHVMFLADLPKAAAVAALDPERSPGDTFVVCGRDVYLRLPNGGAKTKLTNAYFDSKLVTVSTVRNWRTTTKLLELMTG
jgi:uncharacterized protein (DUF1697 family)